MKILVIGAGAVGGYFGGRLAQAGHELYFTAKGDHLKAIKPVDRTLDQNRRMDDLELVIKEADQAERDMGAEASEEKQFRNITGFNAQRSAIDLSDEDLKAAGKLAQGFADRGASVPGMEDVFQESEKRKSDQSVEDESRKRIERIAQSVPVGKETPSTWDFDTIESLGPDAVVLLRNLKREHPGLTAENAQSVLTPGEYRDFKLWDELAEEYDNLEANRTKAASERAQAETELADMDKRRAEGGGLDVGP